MSDAHEIIKELAERDPIVAVGYDEDQECYFCNAWIWAGHEHEKDCLWARAVAFVEEVKE